MFDKMISWGELITIILFVLGSALLFYLILAIANLLKVLRNVNKLIDDNKENLDKTLKSLPEITENTAKATALIKDNLEDIDKVVKDVGKISTKVKDGVDIIQNDIILKAKSIVDIIDAVKKMFEKRKEKAEKKKKKQDATVYKYTYKRGENEPEIVEVQTYGDTEAPLFEGYVEDESGNIENDDEDDQMDSDIEYQQTKTDELANETVQVDEDKEKIVEEMDESKTEEKDEE